jgi:hypothetical protein
MDCVSRGRDGTVLVLMQPGTLTAVLHILQLPGRQVQVGKLLDCGY